LVKESPVKDILSRAAFAGKVLCTVVFIGIAQACGLSAFAAAFMGQFGVAPSHSRAGKAGILPTADADGRTSP
jgi:hypothetical protein